MMLNQQEKLMNRAFELAIKAKGCTSPNPMVGAVIVSPSGEIIAEGYHQRAGAEHAEIIALEKLSMKAENCTLYVNLEPCCHHGKTPPCTDSIIQSGISRVVLACLDPNQKINGQGAKILKDAGIEVIIGVLQEQAYELNRFFFKWICKGQPWVSLKIAMSLNAKITASQRWITSEQSRIRVHELRSEHDAVLTGSGTVLSDDPELTVRHVSGKQPLRAVLDRTMRSNPLTHKVFNRMPDCPKTLLFTSDDGSGEKFLDGDCERLFYSGELSEVLSELGKRNVLSVLVEAGQKLSSSFVQEKLFDELYVFMNPELIVSGRELDFYLGNTEHKLNLIDLKRCDNDLLLQLRP